MTNPPDWRIDESTMKIGFSSLACPGWDLQTIVARAREYGFDGIELGRNGWHAEGSLIAGGAALVGAMSGWELGPYRLELSRDELAMVGASICAGLAIAGCSLAMERSEARARSRNAMRRLKWILFRTKKPAGSDLFPPIGNGSKPAASAGPVGAAGTDNLANFTARGACP